MADTDYTLTDDTIRRIADYVGRYTRRPINNVALYRPQKYVLGLPGEIKWGLTAPSIGPLGPFELRIENKPSPDIHYDDPDGVFSGLNIPLVWVPNTWVPIITTPDYRLLPFDTWMLGSFGKLNNFPDQPPVADWPQSYVTIEGGQADGQIVYVGTFPLPPGIYLLNHAQSYAVRVSDSKGLPPNTTTATIISQACGRED